MKNSLLLLLLLNFFTVFSQKSYLKNYFESGILKEEGWVENGLKQGYWYYYHSNGKIKEQGHYKNDLQEGYWYYFYKSSIKKKEGHFKKGIQNNWWVYYDKEGNVNHKCQLKNNEKNGYCLLYKDNKLVKASKFEGGKKIDEWKDLASFKKENNLNDLR